MARQGETERGDGPRARRGEDELVQSVRKAALEVTLEWTAPRDHKGMCANPGRLQATMRSAILVP